MSNKWNQSDTAVLIRDRAAGRHPAETAKRLGRRVGDVMLKASGLKIPFAHSPYAPDRNKNVSPIVRGPNGVMRAIFDTIGRTLSDTTPIQSALERMAADVSFSSAIPERAEVTAPIVTPDVASSEVVERKNAAEPQVSVAPSDDSAVPDEPSEKPDSEPVPEPEDVRPVEQPQTNMVSPPGRSRIAYLVAGSDDAVDSFKKSIDSGIEPSRPKKTVPQPPAPPVHASVPEPSKPVVPSPAPLKASQADTVRKEAVRPSGDAPKPTPKGFVQTPKVSVPAPKVMERHSPKPPTPPLSHRPAPTPASIIPVKPKPPVPSVSILSPKAPESPVTVAPVAPKPSPSRFVEPSNVTAPVTSEKEDRFQIDPVTGEIMSDASLRRKAIENAPVASRETDTDKPYQPTAAEKRARMRQLREAAKKVGPPSGRLVSEEEGFRKIMSVLG